jgi:hypothetical protein
VPLSDKFARESFDNVGEAAGLGKGQAFGGYK